VKKLAAAIVLLVTVWFSVTLLGAGLIQRSVEQELIGNPESTSVIERLQLALRLDPDNPDTLTVLSRLQPDDQSLESLRRLTKIKPNDGSVWVDLFAVKMQLGELDEESQQALRQAVQLAPYEPEVIERVVQAGSRRWLSLDGEARQLVNEMAIRGIEGRFHHRKSEILATLDQRGMLRMACTSPRVSSCTSTNTPPKTPPSNNNWLKPNVLEGGVASENS